MYVCMYCMYNVGLLRVHSNLITNKAAHRFNHKIKVYRPMLRSQHAMPTTTATPKIEKSAGFFCHLIQNYDMNGIYIV